MCGSVGEEEDDDNVCQGREDIDEIGCHSDELSRRAGQEIEAEVADGQVCQMDGLNGVAPDRDRIQVGGHDSHGIRGGDGGEEDHERDGARDGVKEPEEHQEEKCSGVHG